MTLTDEQQQQQQAIPSSSASSANQRKRLSGFFNNLIHRRDPQPPIQEEQPVQKSEDPPPPPPPTIPPPRLPPPTLQELGLSLSVVTQNLQPSHFTTPPSSGAFLSPNYLLLCHAQGLDVLPITSPPEAQPLPLIRRVSFKSIVIMEQRGVLVAIAGRRDGVRVYALEEIRKAVEWRIDVQIRRERERQRREQSKKQQASGLLIESRHSSEKLRKPSSSTPPPGAQTSAKVSMPRKASQTSLTPTSTTMSIPPPPRLPPAPPVPLIPRTPTIRKAKPPKPTPPQPSGLPPPYSPPITEPEAPPTSSSPPPPSRPIASRSRGTSISEVLAVPPISRINTATDTTRPRDPDAKGDWIESSDEEAIDVVAAGSSGSQALDERTSAIHHSSPTHNPQSASGSTASTLTATAPSRTHRRSLSRRNRPANLDLSVTHTHPIDPSEPSPAPTLITLRQALASPPMNPLNDGDDDDGDEDDGAISLTQALLESRLPDLPPPGTTRPQEPIFIPSSHSTANASEEEPGSPRTSEAHSHLSTRSEATSNNITRNRRRRWSLMINGGSSQSNPSLDRSLPSSPTSASMPLSASALTTPISRDSRARSPNRLSRANSHRTNNASPTPTRRPSSAHADTTNRRAATSPPLPLDHPALIPIPSSSRSSRFLPRIISNALNNMRLDDRPSTSPGGIDSGIGGGGGANGNKKFSSTPLVAPPPAAKLEYVKLPGTKGSLMIKAVETAKKSFLAILCGDNGEKVELFAGTYRTALGLSRTFILPDSPRSLELQLQGDDLVEVFLVFSQNVFGLEPATVRVREVRIGRAERRAARRRAREARAGTAGGGTSAAGGDGSVNETDGPGDEETNVNVSIGVSVAMGSTTPNGTLGTTSPEPPHTPAFIPNEHPRQASERERDRDANGSADDNAEPDGIATPAEGAEGTVTSTAVAHAEELLTLATAHMGPYTTFQQLSFAPQFPLASIADDYVIPPTYPEFMDYRKTYEAEIQEISVEAQEETEGGSGDAGTSVSANGTGETGTTNASASGSSSSASDVTPIQFSPPGLPVPTATAPSKWFYRDPKGVVHGPWRASLMQSWYKDSLLPPDLPVRREEDTEFTLLKDLRLQCVDPIHPFSSPLPSSPSTAMTSASIKPSNDPSGSIYQPTDKPLLKPISLLVQPKHFGPPALFFSSRGGHSTTIVDARGRSVLKERFFWSDDEGGQDDDTKPTSLTGRMGDVKRLEAVDIKDRSVLIAMRQGGVEAVDLSDALLRPADDSRAVLPQFTAASSSINRRAPFVWRIGTPVSSSPTSDTSTVLTNGSNLSKSHKGNQSSHSISLTRPSKLGGGNSAKSPGGKTDFNSGGEPEEFLDEVLFLGRREDEIYICERNAGSFRILRLCPTVKNS